MAEDATRDLRQVWSTANVHPRDRVAFWVDAICESSVHLESTPRPGSFSAIFSVDPMGPLLVATAASVAQTITRAPRHVGRDAPHFCFIMQSAGRARISQDGRDAELGPGDLALTDSTRPFRMDFARDFAQTVLHIPRELLVSRIGAVEHFTASRIDGRNGFAGLLSPMLGKLGEQLPDIRADARARIAANALDLIATALLTESRQLPISAAMTQTRVKFWIETHLAEDLSGERIAAACGLSVRHLNRLFASEGTSLMRYVWERRLAQCRLNLTDRAMRHRPIGAIALAAGFKELSHFSHAYRARYGRTARDERAATADSARAAGE